MNQIMSYLAHRSKIFVVLLSFGILALITFLDRLTGYELSFSIFYLIPIALVTWFAGWQGGLGFSIVSSGLWLWADLAAGQSYSSVAIPYWNALVRFGFFIIVTFMLTERQQQQIRQEELNHFIVHDLRSPLSSLMMGLETMHEMEGELDEMTYRELVSVSLVSVRRLIDLVNSLLDLARLETKQMPVVWERFMALAVIQRAFDQVAVWSKRAGITVQMVLDSDEMTLVADPVLVERVLINLVSNSIKFSERNSQIVVQVTAVDDDRTMVRVIDEGRGIPVEWTKKVFDKYAQVEARRQGKPLGTGLGLAFCREAVEAQHGSIWVEANRPGGTTIAFVLPGQKAGVARTKDF